MPSFFQRFRHGEWVDHLVLAAQILIVMFTLLGIAALLTLNPFLLLSFIFAQPIAVLGLVLFLIAAAFFDRAMVVEYFDPGEVIFLEGAPSRSVYLVKSGTVEGVYTGPDGEKSTIATFARGDYLGLAALAQRMPYRFTATAATPVEVLRVRPRDFATMFAEIPELKNEIPILRKKIEEAIERSALAQRGKPGA